MKSKIQRAPEAEDGEIVSSPELDAADLEIKIHADVTSSEDSDIEETTATTPTKEKSPRDDVITINTPEEKSAVKSSVHNDFPQKEQPISKKRIHSVVHNDDDVEIDHLEITAPQQQEVKKAKKQKDSPSKPSKYSSSTTATATMKDRRPHRPQHSPAKDDSNRKRTFDMFDERHSRSDPEDKHRKSNKRDDSVDDLRKHLLKKGEAKQPATNRDYDYDRGGRSGGSDRERGREREKRKETTDQARSDVKEKSYSKSRSEYERYVESTKTSRDSYDSEHKKKTSQRDNNRYKDNEDGGESHKALEKKDKNKHKKTEDTKQRIPKRMISKQKIKINRKRKKFHIKNWLVLVFFFF